MRVSVWVGWGQSSCTAVMQSVVAFVDDYWRCVVRTGEFLPLRITAWCRGTQRCHGTVPVHKREGKVRGGGIKRVRERERERERMSITITHLYVQVHNVSEKISTIILSYNHYSLRWCDWGSWLRWSPGWAPWRQLGRKRPSLRHLFNHHLQQQI